MKMLLRPGSPLATMKRWCSRGLAPSTRHGSRFGRRARLSERAVERRMSPDRFLSSLHPSSEPVLHLGNRAWPSSSGTGTGTGT